MCSSDLVFQGQMRRAYMASARFAINTTVGVAGIFDVATKWGFPKHEEDLGQTLAVWGAPEGPYLMLPVFGPSNPRDAVGLAGSFFLDPVNMVVTNDYPAVGRDSARARWFPTANRWQRTVIPRAFALSWHSSSAALLALSWLR